MDSGTQVKQDDFKAAVKQFTIQMKTVQKNLDDQVKDKRANAAEMFEAARLQSNIIFHLDDESIPGIELGALEATPGHPSSIAPNAHTRKQKRNNLTSEKVMNATTVLSEIFKRIAIVLA